MTFSKYCFHKWEYFEPEVTYNMSAHSLSHEPLQASGKGTVLLTSVCQSMQLQTSYVFPTHALNHFLQLVK